MNRIARATLALGVFALFGIGNAANAQYVYFPNDATINYDIAADAVIGYPDGASFQNQRNGTNPTIGFVSGVTSELSPHNRSVVNVSGGSIDALYSDDNSIVNMSGGFVDNIYAFKNSTVNVSGGRVGYALDAFDNSVINVNGGNITASLDAEPGGTVNVRGGNIPYSFFSAFAVNPGGAINFYGSNVTASFYVSFYHNYTEYLMNGTLSDGSVLNGNRLIVYYGDNAKFTITNVPEPGNLAFLFGMVSVGVTVLRKRRNSTGFSTHITASKEQRP